MKNETKRHGWRKTAAALGGCVALAACTVGPDYQPPEASVAPEYASLADQAHDGSQPSVLAAEKGPDTAWWKTLHDEELESLVGRAKSGNLDLQAAESRLVESRAAARLAGLELLPTLKTMGELTHVETGKIPGFSSGSTDDSSDNNGNGSSDSSSGPKKIRTSIWIAGLDASWELDVFGGRRREIEAATADLKSNEEARHDLLVSLSAEVARDYLSLRDMQERLRIAQENLDIQQESLNLTQSLNRSGFNTQLDVSRAKSQAAETRASLAPLKTEVRHEEHALAILLGLAPNALIAELDAAKPVPTVPATVPTGMPADLLRRRPDIRRAEQQMIAANARVGAALAGYYPKFAISGDFGKDAGQFSGLFDWANRYLFVSPVVSWDFFGLGRTSAQVEEAKSRYEQAVLAYRSAILTALREVEDALVAYANEQEHRASLATSEAAARDAVTVAKDQYQQGVIDFLQVLDAQRQLLTVQDELATSNATVALNLIAVYKALGGGWEEAD